MVNATAFKSLNPTDLDAAVSLLRKLGRQSAADGLITSYVRARESDRELFDLINSPFGDTVQDPALRQVFAAKYSAVCTRVSLREAVETMAKGRGYSRDDSRAVAGASVDDFYELFKGELSVRKRAAIQACLRFQEAPHTREQVVAALKRIGLESKINAIRVRAYGVDLDDKGEHPTVAEAG